MKAGKREIYLLVVLFLIAYGFFFYKVIWGNAYPKIEEVQNNIEVENKKKQALESDLKNIEELKKSLESKNVQDERLAEYLMTEANVADNIEYVDKLARLFYGKIGDASVSRPVDKKTEQSKTSFYEFKIDFKALMTYGEAVNLVNYLEGGSRKVKISSFDLKPRVASGNADAGYLNDPDKEVEVSMAVNLYSLSLGNANKLYEYSRTRFNRFHDGDGVFFVPTALTIGDGNAVADAGGLPSGNVVAFNKDIEIKLESFLVGGQNFLVYCKESNKHISFKTRIRPKVTLVFNGNTCSVDIVGNSGEQKNLDSSITKEKVDISIITNFTLNASENKDLGLDVYIQNNSGKNINILLNDSIRRARILDRNGNSIYRTNSTEKVTIL
jgi:hypothetical protein